MADLNSVLQSIQYLHQDAQRALPVIPNNGNPAGAYNMSQAEAARPPLPSMSPADRYPWLKPSPSVENIRNLLANKKMQAPVMPPSIQQPAMPQPLPVLPQFRGF